MFFLELMAGSNNNINVLQRSPQVRNFTYDMHDDLHFELNSWLHSRYYLLVDGIYIYIYPTWSIFVQFIKDPQGENRKYSASKQELAKINVEGCFGVLKAS